MKLTEEQENKIKQRVEAQGIGLKTLKDDIIDHLYCVVETELGKGKSFDELLNQAIIELAPEGLADLENKTLFLLNYKRSLLIKKVIYSTGFIGASNLALGITFKLLNMPYGNLLFIIGFLILFLIFFPLFALDRYKIALSKNISIRLKFILGTSAAIITGLSGVFKLFHLQGAPILLALGGLLFSIGFLPFLFFTMYKKSVSN